MSNEIQTQQPRSPTFSERLARASATMPVDMIPGDLSPDLLQRTMERLRAAMVACAMRSPEIADCSMSSVLRALVLCAQIRLTPDSTPHSPVYLIPRRNKRNNNALELTAQLSFRGYLALAERAGWSIKVGIVYEGDTFEVETTAEADSLRHVPSFEHSEIGPNLEGIRAAYAIARKPGHTPLIVTMTRSQILKRRAVSQDYTYNKARSFWTKWPDEMIYKTVVAYLFRRTISGVEEVSSAIQHEDEDARAEVVRDRPRDPLAAIEVQHEQTSPEDGYADAEGGDAWHDHPPSDDEAAWLAGDGGPDGERA